MRYCSVESDCAVQHSICTDFASGIGSSIGISNDISISIFSTGTDSSLGVILSMTVGTGIGIGIDIHSCARLYH